MKQYNNRIDLDLSLHELAKEVRGLAPCSHLFNAHDRWVIQQCCTQLRQLGNTKSHPAETVWGKLKNLIRFL